MQTNNTQYKVCNAVNFNQDVHHQVRHQVPIFGSCPAFRGFCYSKMTKQQHAGTSANSPSYKGFYLSQLFIKRVDCNILMPFQTSLRDFGRDSLGKEFRLLLNRHSKPVPVEMILKLIENEQGNKSVSGLSYHNLTRKQQNILLSNN